MLDIKLIRENPEKIKEAIGSKHIKDVSVGDVDKILDLDKKNRDLISTAQKLLEERNKAQHNFQIIKNAVEQKSQKITPSVLKRALDLKQEIKKAEEKERVAEKEFMQALLNLPNIPKPDVKLGKDESENEVVRKYKEPKKLSFTPKDHLELGENLNILDVKSASDVSGARFAYLKNEAVMLEFAIIQYAMEVLLKEGFTPIIPPALIKQEVTSGLGYWQAGGHGDHYLVFDPVCRSCGVDLGSLNLLKILGKDKFKKDLKALHISDVSIKHLQENNSPIHPQYIEGVKNCLHCGADLTSVYLYLIGTAEHSIVPIHKDEVLNKKDLPKRYVGFSPAFRRESGSYGKDTRGIFRVHQFDKIEMVSFVAEEDDDKEHEYLLSLEEKLWQALEIPYQVVKMCTGDLGFPVARKYDIEAWMPSQNKYREVTSVSTVTDFQSRRLNIKYDDRMPSSTIVQAGRGTRVSGGQIVRKYAHILNGTAFAIGRTIIAILENYQQKDGSVEVPKVLQKYIGKTLIKPRQTR